MMNNEKTIAPFYEAIRNSIIIFAFAGFRVVFKIFTEKQPFQWTGECLKLILIWTTAILGICFGHAYLGSKIGRIKAGLVVGIICAVIGTHFEA